jgi:hypothetical protein
MSSSSRPSAATAASGASSSLSFPDRPRWGLSGRAGLCHRPCRSQRRVDSRHPARRLHPPMRRSSDGQASGNFNSRCRRQSEIARDRCAAIALSTSAFPTREGNPKSYPIEKDSGVGSGYDLTEKLHFGLVNLAAWFERNPE